MKRSHLVFLQVASLFLVLLTFWAGFVSFSSESWTPWGPIDVPIKPADTETTSSDDAIASDHVLPFPIPSPPEPGPEPEPELELNADINLLFNTTPYVKAILDPTDTTLPRLECPPPDINRYGYLNVTSSNATWPPALKYFFAIDLRQSIEVIPRLLGSVVEVIRLLGPPTCALSIVEGNSDDGTREILHALRGELAALGIAYFVRSSAVDPSTGERIAKLAQLRNLALAPLVRPSTVPMLAARAATDPVPAADASTTVVFLNDVAACAADILELVHQRAFQGAHMTCAMDWTYVGPNPTFYDVWVARTLSGDLFFDIPAVDSSWDKAWNLFWNDFQAQQRFRRMLPFQVYACWNGAVAFGAAPILEDSADNDGEEERRKGKGVKGEKGGKIEFRASREGECYAGEPTLFCKDLWWHGFGRIAVVPSVNLEYSNEAAEKIKDLKGHTSQWTARENIQDMKIEWEDEPPDMVKCMPDFGDQSWRPWNETLA
ncbi:alpha-1,3-mannosyltransferase CMT1 [Biscogniauxia mediterranea]|nr:alpha-1,3-mannosyltransferase CMT1 [Biscogniauxia mediterranea]